jgi:hypothetical protein
MPPSSLPLMKKMNKLMLCSCGRGSSSSLVYGHKCQSVIYGLVSGPVYFATLSYVDVSIDLSPLVEPFIGDVMSVKTVISAVMPVAFAIEGFASCLMVSLLCLCSGV